MHERLGWSNIEALTCLVGKPWNEITQSYLRALRPSTVRIAEYGKCVTSDAKLWRVTVYLSATKTVDRIEQEVEVDLPPDVAHAHDLDTRMRRL